MGIDISQNSTGFAIMENGVVLKNGYIKNPLKQPVGEYLQRIRKSIIYLLKSNNVELVIIEDIFIQFNTVAKKINQVHGVVKEACRSVLDIEVILYPQQTWRSTLGIKNLTKKEKDALIPVAKEVKGEKYKTYHKHLCDVKHRVVAYVNKRLNSEYTFEENDITDAIGLILAYEEKNEIHTT